MQKLIECYRAITGNLTFDNVSDVWDFKEKGHYYNRGAGYAPEFLVYMIVIWI